MSKFYCRFLFCILIIRSGFAGFCQSDDSNFIRNYKAPDFKYRQLKLSIESKGNGFSLDSNEFFQLDFGNTLGYYQISNKKNYQGQLNTGASFHVAYNGSQISKNLGLATFVNNTTSNRFYFNKLWYFGVHDRSLLGILYSNPISDSISNESNYTLTVKPAISIGYGRVEWVQFARQAMDIERSLEACDRLNHLMTETELKYLSDKIAQIRNRRYYDIRLGRIDQLQALDSLLSVEGLVNQTDIMYFTQLQDAYLYSYYTTRLSGYRHELGISQALDIANSGTEENTMTIGFYTYSLYVPISYALQHDFEITLIGGYIENSDIITSQFAGWLDCSYKLGVYPNTRTYLGAEIKGGLNAHSSTTGYSTGLTLDGYYYLSPRVRFWAKGHCVFGENYYTHDFDHIAVVNSSKVPRGITYSFRAGFSYDIF